MGGAVRGGRGGTQGAGLWLLWDLNVAGETGTPSQIWGRSFALIWEPPWGWGGQRPSGQILPSASGLWTRGLWVTGDAAGFSHSAPRGKPACAGRLVGLQG